MSILKVNSIQTATPDTSLEINSDIKFIGVICATTIYVGETTVITTGGTSSNQGYIWLLGEPISPGNKPSPSDNYFNIQLVSGVTSNTLNPNNILRIKVNDGDTSSISRNAWWNTLYQNHVNGLLQITYAGDASINATLQISSMIGIGIGWQIEGKVIAGPSSGTTFPVYERHYLNWSFGPSSGGTGGGGVISGGSIQVTYSELVDKITGGTLTTGVYYTITDYKTLYDQPNYDYDKNAITSGIYKNTAPIEPIIVFATSSNTISTDAYQPAYPNDKIKYDWTFNQTEVTQGGAVGRITERIDDLNNRTDYDHRNILFRRYKYYEIDLYSPYQGTVQVTHISGNTMDVIGSGTNFTSLFTGTIVGFDVYSSAKVYKNIDSDTGMTITGLSVVSLGPNEKIYQTNDEGYVSFYQNNISTSDYEEYYTFHDNNQTYFNNYIGNFSNIGIYEGANFILANNVFLDGSYQNNKFGDGCYNNTFNDDCYDNIIGNYFYNNITNDDFDGNVIGNNFNNNRITSNFQYNRIGENFQHNYIIQYNFYRNNIMNYFEYNKISGGDFQNNEIGNQFANNQIKNQFYKNDIGNGFNNNNIFSEFYGNLIGNGYNDNDVYSIFRDNKIGEVFNNNTISNQDSLGAYNFENNELMNNFKGNDIKQNFWSNRIKTDFKGNITFQQFGYNDIGFGCAANTFSGETIHNTIGDYFGVNNLEGYFSYNKIGSDFVSNIIGTDFGFGGGQYQGNIIGNNFYNNDIGEYFYNNIIPDNFYDNIIGDYFQWNTFSSNIDNIDFGAYYGNITSFTYTATGSTAADNIYNSIGGLTDHNGQNANFNIQVSGNTVIGITGDSQGRYYDVNDTITISGTSIGGSTPDDDIVITVTGISPKPSVYETYSCNIFQRQFGDKRLSYYDDLDALTIKDIDR